MYHTDVCMMSKTLAECGVVSRDPSQHDKAPVARMRGLPDPSFQPI